MTDETSEKGLTSSPVDLGIFGRRTTRTGVRAADTIAIILSALWLFAVAVFVAVVRIGGGALGIDTLTFVMIFIAVAMPIGLIWVAASAAKSAQVMHEEAARLQTTVDAMRHAYIQQQQSTGLSVRPSVEKKIDQIAEAQKQTENAIATFATTRVGAPPTRPVQGLAADNGNPQPLLELGTPAEDLSPPLGTTDFIAAMNFPEDTDDQAGFASLRRALQDRSVSKLVRSAQDVLTLLSQDGIYMDDLHPDRARPEIWRKFANGERGVAVSALGGVRDRSSLALASGRMRQDPVFRDTVHHFLRLFDQHLTGFEPTASDQDLVDLAATRTARAFMLLGRVTGTFD